MKRVVRRYRAKTDVFLCLPKNYVKVFCDNKRYGNCQLSADYEDLIVYGRGEEKIKNDGTAGKVVRR